MSNMHATQANKIAEDYNQKRADSLFDRWLIDVRSCIDQSARGGHFGCLANEVTKINTRTGQILEAKLRKVLEPEGYKISPGPGETVHIEWR